ncbi:MAG: BsaWI family type II restriction enzyme [Candidatus Poribacteria bacterium]|nr:BsaWI family type II restriction enzyme [Candidatus Poribacteria bacterium]
MDELIKAAPTARGGTSLDGRRNILTDALYEMGYDDTLVDTLIERNVIDFSSVNYTSDVIDDLIEHYGESVLCGGLADAVICESLDASLIGAVGRSWRASKGDTFRARILYMIAAPIESLGLKVIESSELEVIKLMPQLDAVKRNVVIDYGEFGMQLPDTDIIVYSPENSQIIAIISSKISVRESVIQTGYWKSKLLESENTKHIKVYLITPDANKDLTRINPAKEPRIIAETDLDGTYVLTTEALEESDKVKLFEHFIEDLKRLLERH